MTQKEQILLVGGFVRDHLLGRVSKDMDWLVVGMTEERFMELNPSAKSVGVTFPVLRVDGDEFAFARTETSTGPGYNDFVVDAGPHVTLEQDLLRRDLTINTFAMCPETGEIVCAPNAWEDLEDKVLRHTSPEFKDDPLRVFRLARFKAKFPDWEIHPDTVRLCRSMKDMLPALFKERVWTEVLGALGAREPAEFFRTLRELDALDFWFKELADNIGVPAGPKRFHPEEDNFVHLMETLERCAELTHNRKSRWAALCHDLGKSMTDPELWPKTPLHEKLGMEVADKLCRRLGASVPFRKAAVMACEEHMRFCHTWEMKPGKVVNMMQRLLKFPGGIDGFFDVVHADGANPPQTEDFKAAMVVVMAVRLPKKHHDRGPLSGEILTNLRSLAWKEFKQNMRG